MPSPDRLRSRFTASPPGATLRRMSSIDRQSDGACQDHLKISQDHLKRLVAARVENLRLRNEAQKQARRLDDLRAGLGCGSVLFAMVMVSLVGVHIINRDLSASLDRAHAANEHLSAALGQVAAEREALALLTLSHDADPRADVPSDVDEILRINELDETLSTDLPKAPESTDMSDKTAGSTDHVSSSTVERPCTPHKLDSSRTLFDCSARLRGGSGSPVASTTTAGAGGTLTLSARSGPSFRDVRNVSYETQDEAPRDRKKHR